MDIRGFGTAPSTAQTKKKKGFLLDQVSTGGGIGGALAGAAGGAAIGSAVPIVGTAIGGLLGAVIGGGLGSAGGEVAENAITGDDLSQNVLKEGLVGGVTSLPFGAGLKLARAGVKAGTGFGAKSASQLVQEAGAQTVGKGTAARLGLDAGAGLAATGGRASTIGTDLQRRVANTSKVADSYTQELGLVDALRRNGLSGSATNMYKQVDGKIGELSGQIQTKLSSIPTTTPRATVVNTLKTSVTDVLPEDATYTREIARSLDRLAKSGNGAGDVTASELFGFKQSLGNRLSPAFKKMDRGASLTAKEEVEMALWRNIDDEITRIAPGVKDLTMDQSRLITARPALQAGSNKTAGIPIAGIKSQKLEQGVQAVQSRLGDVLAGTGPAAAKTAGQGIVPLAVRQGLGRAVTADAAPVDPALTDPTLTSGAGTFSDLGGLEAPAPTNSTGYSSAQLGQALMAAYSEGDEASAKVLEQMYALASEQEAAASTAAEPLSAEASKVVGNANSGLQSIAQLEGIISGNGGQVSKATLVPGRELLGGAIGNALGTSSYDTINRNISDVITRLRTGAALTDQEASFYASQLPQAFDDPETIRLKLQTFKDLFNSVATRTGSAGTDMQAMIRAS